MEAFTGVDSLELYMSGGADNYMAEDSLGGQISSKVIRGMNAVFNGTPIQSLVIEDVTPECLEGDASLVVVSGELVFVPPDGLAGDPVAIAAGERKLIPGNDPDKAVRVYRTPGQTFEGTSSFELKDILNGVLSMSNVPNSDRVSGETTYRAVFVKARQFVEDVLAWIETDGQATYELAVEESESGDVIQTISDEYTAPTGLSWVQADAESTAIELTDSLGLSEDETVGLWIKRIFPASGVLAIREQVDFHLQFVAG